MYTYIKYFFFYKIYLKYWYLSFIFSSNSFSFVKGVKDVKVCFQVKISGKSEICYLGKSTILLLKFE